MLSSRVPMVFEMMSVLFLLVVCMIAGVYSVDPTPVKQKETSLDGTVTLSYTLSKIDKWSDNFFWYRQYPGEPPQFLLTISGFGN
ncbi:unnamed protein product [Boreogadus saida]